MKQQASRLINATPQAIRSVLLDPLRLPEWNPAFRSITGGQVAVPHQRYALVVSMGLSGSFSYQVIAPDRIDTAWQVPGFSETGSWQLRPRVAGTLVTHGFQHTGPLAALLRHAYRGVAELRLERLSERASD